MSARQDDQEPSNLDDTDDPGPASPARHVWLRRRFMLRHFGEPQRAIHWTSLVTHRFALDGIQDAYDLFSH